MDIKVGIIGSETTFHYVNAVPVEMKPQAEFMTLSGYIKTQENPMTYHSYSITWLALTKSEKNALLAILRSSTSLNLQFEDEDYSNHNVKFRWPITKGLSLNYPGYYEVTASCVEVGVA